LGHKRLAVSGAGPVANGGPLVPAGLQSPGAAGPTQRHDEGRLHGAAPSLVLLHRPRTSAVWDQSHLGLQSGPAAGHRHAHAGHRQVHVTLHTQQRLTDVRSPRECEMMRYDVKDIPALFLLDVV